MHRRKMVYFQESRPFRRIPSSSFLKNRKKTTKSRIIRRAAGIQFPLENTAFCIITLLSINISIL